MIFVGDPLQKVALSGDILYDQDLVANQGRARQAGLSSLRPPTSQPMVSLVVSSRLTPFVIFLLPRSCRVTVQDLGHVLSCAAIRTAVPWCVPWRRAAAHGPSPPLSPPAFTGRLQLMSSPPCSSRHNYFTLEHSFRQEDDRDFDVFLRHLREGRLAQCEAKVGGFKRTSGCVSRLCQVHPMHPRVTFVASVMYISPQLEEYTHRTEGSTNHLETAALFLTRGEVTTYHDNLLCRNQCSTSCLSPFHITYSFFFMSSISFTKIGGQ